MGTAVDKTAKYSKDYKTNYKSIIYCSNILIIQCLYTLKNSCFIVFCRDPLSKKSSAVWKLTNSSYNTKLLGHDIISKSICVLMVITLEESCELKRRHRMLFFSCYRKIPKPRK